METIIRAHTEWVLMAKAYKGLSIKEHRQRQASKLATLIVEYGQEVLNLECEEARQLYFVWEKAYAKTD